MLSLLLYCSLALVFNSTAAINHSLVLKAAYSCTFYSSSTLDFWLNQLFLAYTFVYVCVFTRPCLFCLVMQSYMPPHVTLRGFHCVCDLLIVIFCSYLGLRFLCLFFTFYIEFFFSAAPTEIIVQELR